MKLYPKRKLLSTVYVLGWGKGIIMERCVACTQHPPMYKVKLQGGTIIGQVQEKHFLEYTEVEDFAEEPERSIPRLVKG